MKNRTKEKTMRLPTFALLLALLLVLGLWGTAAGAATITVNATGDAAATDGSCTLREAVNNANANTDTTGGDCAAGLGADTIAFAIPGPGPHTVNVTAELRVTDTVTIDGLTQPANGGPAADCNNGPLLVELRGNGTFWYRGIYLYYSNNNVVRGLAVGGFENAVRGYQSDSNRIECNFLGTDATGTASVANETGIRLATGSSYNVIEGNLISGNAGDGTVKPGYGISISGSPDNRISGNKIGTDVTGTLSLPNNVGVRISAGSARTIVGTNGDGTNDAAEGNLISGHSVGLGYAVYPSDSNTDDVWIAGNLIGTDITGTVALPNTTGVRIRRRAERTLVGTNGDGVSDALERNVISGNTAGSGYAVRATGVGTDGLRVAGNYIGTDVTGTVALPNATGVRISGGASNVTIGTDSNGFGDAVEGNLISGNTAGYGYGVYASDQSTAGFVVAGNLIGTDVTGTLPLGNGVGVRLRGIGGARVGTDGDGWNDTGERNVISGHTTGTAYGVYISGRGTEGNNVSGNKVSGNYIGTDVTGTAAIANNAGVRLKGGAAMNVIGTDGDGFGDDVEGNVISGHTGTLGYGVYLSESSTMGNVIAGNLIGTDATGTAPLQTPNGTGNKAAVRIRDGASFNVIGSNLDGISDDFEGNVVSGNERAPGEYYHRGIRISDATTIGNQVVGNVIGTSRDGSVVLGNDQGILLADSTMTAVVSNRIRGNFYGIRLDSSAVFENLVLLSEGNCIEGNTYRGLDNRGSTYVTFENNWWGDTGGPSGYASGAGDWISLGVDYSPHMSAAPAGCGGGAAATVPDVQLSDALSAGMPTDQRAVLFRRAATESDAMLGELELYLADAYRTANDDAALGRTLELLSFIATPEASDVLSRLAELDPAFFAPAMDRMLEYAFGRDDAHALIAHVADDAHPALAEAALTWMERMTATAIVE